MPSRVETVHLPPSAFLRRRRPTPLLGTATRGRPKPEHVCSKSSSTLHLMPAGSHFLPGLLFRSKVASSLITDYISSCFIPSTFRPATRRHGLAGQHRPLRGNRRRGEVRAGGTRQGGQLGQLSPDAPAGHLRRGRPPGLFRSVRHKQYVSKVNPLWVHTGKVTKSSMGVYYWLCEDVFFFLEGRPHGSKERDILHLVSLVGKERRRFCRK